MIDTRRAKLINFAARWHNGQHRADKETPYSLITWGHANQKTLWKMNLIVNRCTVIRDNGVEVCYALHDLRQVLDKKYKGGNYEAS
jgi:hypothetical protein